MTLGQAIARRDVSKQLRTLELQLAADTERLQADLEQIELQLSAVEQELQSREAERDRTRSATANGAIPSLTQQRGREDRRES